MQLSGITLAIKVWKNVQKKIWILNTVRERLEMKEIAETIHRTFRWIKLKTPVIATRYNKNEPESISLC